MKYKTIVIFTAVFALIIAVFMISPTTDIQENPIPGISEHFEQPDISKIGKETVYQFQDREKGARILVITDEQNRIRELLFEANYKKGYSLFYKNVLNSFIIKKKHLPVVLPSILNKASTSAMYHAMGSSKGIEHFYFTHEGFILVHYLIQNPSTAYTA